MNQPKIVVLDAVMKSQLYWQVHLKRRWYYPVNSAGQRIDELNLIEESLKIWKCERYIRTGCCGSMTKVLNVSQVLTGEVWRE